MTARRGLTLIEVLIAVTILATLAAVCAPVIARSLRLLQSEPAADLFDLSRFADDVIADPEAFGIEDWRAATSIGISPAEVFELGAVQLEVLAPNSPVTSHAWMRFAEDSGQRVYRWVFWPPAEEGEDN